MERYAQENGFRNTLFYLDDGVSGTTFERLGFQQMIADIEAGLVKTVIVKDKSRFGRGVRFIAINDGVDSDKGESDFTVLQCFQRVVTRYLRQERAEMTADLKLYMQTQNYVLSPQSKNRHSRWRKEYCPTPSIQNI